MTSEKVTTSEEVDKVTENLDEMKESVVTIRRKNLDNFEGQSKGSTGWFNIDNEFLKRKFLQLNQTYIKNFMKMILKVKIWSHINSLYYPLIILS